MLQKQDRESRILRAATVFFGRKGYALTTVEDVATRAGLAVGTVYNYFRSKQELLLAIAERDTQAQLVAGQKILDAPPDDPVEATAALIEIYANTLERHGRKLWRELLAAVITEARTVGAAVTAGDEQLVAQLGALLKRLQARGILSQDVDTRRAATVLYGVYFTWFTFFVISEDMTMARLRAEVRRGTAIVMCGLLPGRRQPR